MAEDAEWVLDSVLAFLRCPLWTGPVTDFIEQKCSGSWGQGGPPYLTLPQCCAAHNQGFSGGGSCVSAVYGKASLHHACVLHLFMLPCSALRLCTFECVASKTK